jgi:hypothetical protein
MATPTGVAILHPILSYQSYSLTSEVILSFFYIFLLSLLFTVSIYNPSTFSRAQGVLRRNVRLDLMLGLVVKHFIVIDPPSSSHPYSATRYIRIASSVFPCSGSLGCSMGCIITLTRCRDYLVSLHKNTFSV